MKNYRLAEWFYSLQGEGVRAGTANVFIRFAGCNLLCTEEPCEGSSPGFAGQGAGFNCDTDWSHGDAFTSYEVVRLVARLAGGCKWVLFTGGEPALQLDEYLVNAIHFAGFSIAIETNGTCELPKGLVGEFAGGQDWICVSPKTTEDRLAVFHADEVKYVVVTDGPFPPPVSKIKATHKLVSPAFATPAKLQGGGFFIPPFGIDRRGILHLEACIKFVRANPDWRLSVQNHKLWGVL